MWYADLFSNGEYLKAFVFSDYYPPLYHLLAMPFAHSYHAAITINLVFLAILIVSIYGIGKHLFSSEAGLFAATLTTLYPYLVLMRHDFLLDFALVAMVSLSFFMLLKTEGFSKRNYSLLFGASFGLAILTKWTAVFFIVPTVLAILVINRPRVNRNNLFYAFFTFLICGGIWYLVNLEVLFAIFSGQELWGTMENDPNIFSLASAWYYTHAAIKQLGWFFAMLATIGLVWLFKNADKNTRYLIGMSILIPYLIFTFTTNKDLRYLLPLLIFFALATACMLSTIKDKHLKAIVLTIIICVGVLQAVTITQPVIGENWHINDILDTIEENREGNCTVLVLPDHNYINGYTLRYYATVRGMTNCTFKSGFYCFASLEQQAIDEADFIIIKQGGYIGAEWQMAKIGSLYDLHTQHKNEFTNLQSFVQPDNSITHVEIR